MDLYARIYKPMMMHNIHLEGLDCFRCPYGKTRETCDVECFVSAEEAFASHGQETVAVVVEPVLQGAAGMRIYPPLYLKKLRELCDRYGVLMIDDEIAAGFGRTGKFFAIEHAGVSPDILCTSKGLTAGYIPMSIAITTEAVYQAFYDDYGVKIRLTQYISDIKHVFTHREWRMHVYGGEVVDPATRPMSDFYKLEEIEQLTVSTAHLKVLKAYLKVLQ